MNSAALRFAVMALLLSGGLSAHAADAEWYTGLGIGYSRVQFYPADFSSGGASNESTRTVDAGFKGFLGYQINRNWAAEVSYVTVGKFQYKYTSISRIDDYKVTGWGFSAVPTIPLTDSFSLYGRLGGFFSQARITVRDAGVATSDEQSSQISLLAGFGLQYFFSGETGLRIEFENFGKVGNSTCGTCTGRANAKMLSASAVFKF